MAARLKKDKPRLDIRNILVFDDCLSVINFES